MSKLANKLHFFRVLYFITKHHFHSTKLVQDRISKIHNFLPNVPNLIKLRGIALYNQQHERIKYYQLQFPLTFLFTVLIGVE